MKFLRTRGFQQKFLCTFLSPKKIQLLKTRLITLKLEQSFVSKSFKKKDNISSKPVEGRVPTSLEQATGIERFELLQELEGKEAFDLSPLDSSRIGTLKDPIIVDSLDKTRLIGCTGSPADSHEIHWFELSADTQNSRCPECGSVYKLNFIGVEGDINNHH